MGFKRERPTVITAPLPTLSSSSSSGDGALNELDMLPIPSYSNEFSASHGDDSMEFDGSDASQASGSGSDARPRDATITPLDLLPKELRAIANTTRPDSDIPWTSDDRTCYYYKMDADRCFHPRTCRDCLDMPGCMINQLGQCVNQVIDHYNGYMDFRSAITRNFSGPHAKNPNASRTQQYHFPAKVVSYCPLDEPTCRYCRRNDFKKKIDSRFCIGSYNNHKCICISICENPVRDEVLVHKNCTNPLSTSTLANDLVHPLMSTPSIFTIVVAPIILVLVVYQIVQRHRRTRTASADAMLGAPRSGDLDEEVEAADSLWSWSTATAQDTQPEPVIPSGRLDLIGWQAQRQEMIAKEQLLLARLETMSPNSAWMDFEDADDMSDHRRSSVRVDEVPSTNTRDSRAVENTQREFNQRTQADHVYCTESDLAML